MHYDFLEIGKVSSYKNHLKYTKIYYQLKLWSICLATPIYSLFFQWIFRTKCLKPNSHVTSGDHSWFPFSFRCIPLPGKANAHQKPWSWKGWSLLLQTPPLLLVAVWMLLVWKMLGGNWNKTMYNYICKPFFWNKSTWDSSHPGNVRCEKNCH